MLKKAHTFTTLTLSEAELQADSHLFSQLMPKHVTHNKKCRYCTSPVQIPPPKPPPPEMHFIPNPANSEFVCLLGLEECVSKILHEDDKENTAQPVPFSCSQCSTDFTPTWKWDKGSKGT